MKFPVLGMDYIKLNCWSKRFHWKPPIPKKIQSRILIAFHKLMIRYNCWRQHLHNSLNMGKLCWCLPTARTTSWLMLIVLEDTVGGTGKYCSWQCSWYWKGLQEQSQQKPTPNSSIYDGVCLQDVLVQEWHKDGRMKQPTLVVKWNPSLAPRRWPRL